MNNENKTKDGAGRENQTSNNVAKQDIPLPLPGNDDRERIPR
jgi:hypothetical protein